MIKNKIIKLCKKAGSFTLHYDSSRQIQWLSNGFAIYPLQGCPIFDEENFFTTFDIDVSSSLLTILPDLPKGFDFNDGNNLEVEVTRLGLTILDESTDIVAFKTEYGIELFERSCFSPFGDYSKNDLQYFIRHAGKTPYLVVKNGFMLIGIILPKKIIDKQLVDDVKNFAKQLEVTFYNKSEELENG